ncbi:dicarboxylate/amino acid:cation symporter [Candidatus Electrothrix sp.]|uniref:dicarboxylate/amino acid:cation symporter n=1 Tax=Candidatus Electrothrix sp. TaxID=2170559 RepID=UPI0040567A68
MSIKKLLLDPKTVLIGVCAGFIIGLFMKPLGAALFPFGSIYVSFLSMCLVPILITAIIEGIAGLLRDPDTRLLFRTIAVYYIFGLILPCAGGIFTALLLGPGVDLGAEAEKSIGALIIQAPVESGQELGVLDFLATIIPTNIFEALSTNQVMSIVFVSICTGLAMGIIESKGIDRALELVETINETFMQLFRWAIVLLAPGLLFLVAGVVSRIDPNTLIALVKFVVMFYAGGAVLMMLYLLLFWAAVRGPLIPVLAKLSNPNMLALMTNNPVLALPVTLETLEQSFKIDRRVPDLIIPFGIFANQHGAVFLLSFLTVFLSQIYVIDLGLQEYIIIAIGSIIAGSTAVGGGAVLIPTVAPILGAIGIPTPVALVVLATTDNIIGPVRTVLTLQANITLTALTTRSSKEVSEPEYCPEITEET